MPSINQIAGVECTVEENNQDKLSRESLLTNLHFLQRNFKVYNDLQQNKCKMVAKDKHDPNRNADQQPIVQEETEQSKQKHNKKRKIIQQADLQDTKKKSKHAAIRNAAPQATKDNTKVTSRSSQMLLSSNKLHIFFAVCCITSSEFKLFD